MGHHNTIRATMGDIRTTLAEARNRRLGNLGLATPANPPPIPDAAAPPASVVPPPPVLQGGSPDSSMFRSTSPTQEELRADVERAKADYKLRKERYRQAKASRKLAEQREQVQESSGRYFASLLRRNDINLHL
jgi:Wiskott-Aldrich syndrome protein